MSAAPRELTGARKAAILLVSVEQDKAAELLKRMTPDVIEEIGREIASIGEVSAAERRNVLGEFYNMAVANAQITTGGLDYAKSLLKKSLSEQEADAGNP